MPHPVQIQKIHILKGKLGMEDADYRAMLNDAYGKDSSKDLSIGQADELIVSLGRQLDARESQPRKYDYLGSRPGMAAPAQLRMIEAMWKDVSVKKTPVDRAAALDAFLKDRFHILDIVWMEAKEVQKVVFALRRMRVQQQSGKKAA